MNSPFNNNSLMLIHYSNYKQLTLMAVPILWFKLKPALVWGLQKWVQQIKERPVPVSSRNIISPGENRVFSKGTPFAE